MLDPVTLEVIRNALPAIANEMAADLQRTSYNMMIYEVCDFCTALTDAKGQLISQNVGGVSHFVADLGVIIKDIIAREGPDGFDPEDVFITNHQRVAGQHLNNVVIYMPFLHLGKLMGFAMTRAHWIDVGGSSTGLGASPLVGDPWFEGLQIDQLRIYEAGKLNKALHAMIHDNIRYPESSLGDMRAQIAACRLAVQRLKELIERYSPGVVENAVETIYRETEIRCRNVVERIPDGTYEASSVYDDDSVNPDEPIRIHARVTVAGSDMTIDLSGCSPQRIGGVNSRTLAAARVAYKALTEPAAPVNEGSFRALTAVVPEGNVMMARYPPPWAVGASLYRRWSTPFSRRSRPRSRIGFQQRIMACSAALSCFWVGTRRRGATLCFRASKAEAGAAGRSATANRRPFPCARATPRTRPSRVWRSRHR